MRRSARLHLTPTARAMSAALASSASSSAADAGCSDSSLRTPPAGRTDQRAWKHAALRRGMRGHTQPCAAAACMHAPLCMQSSARRVLGCPWPGLLTQDLLADWRLLQPQRLQAALKQAGQHDADRVAKVHAAPGQGAGGRGRSGCGSRQQWCAPQQLAAVSAGGRGAGMRGCLCAAAAHLPCTRPVGIAHACVHSRSSSSVRPLSSRPNTRAVRPGRAGCGGKGGGRGASV